MIASVHYRAGRALISLCAAVSFAGLAPSVASAGAYDVKVCKDGYGNGGALTAGGAGAQFDWLMRVTNNCDGGYGGWNAISVSVNNGPESPDQDPYVPQGTSGNIYSAAPPYAGIRKIHVDQGRMASYYGNTSGWNARVMVPSAGWCRTDGDGGNWCGLGWQTPADNSGQTNWGTPDYPGYGNRDIGPITGEVGDIAIGVVCNGGSTWAARPCYRPKYKPAGGVAIVSADIQVVDNAKPSISGVSGSVVDGQWHRPGDIGFGITGWDNTGISTFQKFVDGNFTGQDNMPCDYSRMKPCEDRAHNGAVSVNGYDGFHTVMIRGVSAAQYWYDCAVDCADAYATVAIDGNAPSAPASTNPGAAWTKANSYALTAPLPASEADPDGGGPQAPSPIARRVVTICPVGQSSGANCTVKDAPPATPGQDASAGGLTVPGEGIWDARVQLVDQVGNVGAASAPVPLRLDQTAPGLTVNQARGGFSITASDSASGPSSVTYRVDGKGEWITDSGERNPRLTSQTVVTVAAPAGQHYVEAKATDNAGNVGNASVRFDVTVPENSENVNDLDPFGADSQLSVVDRGELNGLGGGEQATLTASFVRNAKSKNTKPLTVRTINERGTAALAGQLVDGQGRAIAKARIDLGAAIAGGRTELKKGVAQTDEAGRFSIQLGKGLTSRGLTVAYMARVNDVRPAASAGVELVVKARASFKVHRPRAGKKTQFTGFVSSGYLTKQGVEVKLQWKVGKRFRTFTTTRTDIKGRWKTSWKFERRGARYVMRALVTSSPAYAYKGSASRSRVVRVK